MKSHQVNLISADFRQFESLCDRQTDRKHFSRFVALDHKMQKDEAEKKEAEAFFSAASKLNFGDNDVIVKKEKKENSF